MSKDKTASKKLNQQIIEEAALWETCLDDGPLSVQQNKEFSVWLQQSPDHIKEFLLARAISTDANGIDAEKSISINSLIEASGAEILSLSNTPQHTPVSADRPGASQWRRLLPSLPVAASFFVVALASFLLIGNPFKADEMLYETALGEQRSLVLDDGSIVHLNTLSKVRVRYGEKSRSIELLAGEALFDVAQNPDKPFIVHAAGTTTKALGTVFNVYLSDKTTDVTVIEGKVTVRNQTAAPNAENSAILTMGEAVSSTDSGLTATTKIEHLDTVTAWRLRQLVFRDTPLSTIIYEFNRYNHTQMQVMGLIGPEPHFSGVFDVNNPRAFLSILRATKTAKVTYQNDNTVVIHLISPNQASAATYL